MNPFADRFADTLEPMGVAIGAFLVLVALGTIVGMPWELKGMGAAIFQVLAALATAGIGAGLVYLSWTGSD